MRISDWSSDVCSSDLDVHQQEVITVWFGASDLAGAYGAAGTRFVFHHNSLTQRRAHGFGQRTRHVVGWTACGEGYDHVYGVIWVVGGECSASAKPGAEEHGRADLQGVVRHWVSFEIGKASGWQMLGEAGILGQNHQAVA